MSKPIVYVAGPYIIGNPDINARKNLYSAEMVLEAGAIPIPPLLCHFWKMYFPSKKESQWAEISLAWMHKCDVVWRTKGESAGADHEVAAATEAKIPVVFSYEELKKWLETQTTSPSTTTSTPPTQTPASGQSSSTSSSAASSTKASAPSPASSGSSPTSSQESKSSKPK